jgi:hypothetical protein
VVGGAILGLLGALVLGEICGSDNAQEHCTGTTVGGGLLGAAVGFTVGALVGGQFPKHR